MTNEEQFDRWWSRQTVLKRYQASDVVPVVKASARAAWSARLPEEHLAVVVEALEVAAYEAQREAKQYRQWSKFLKGRDG